MSQILFNDDQTESDVLTDPISLDMNNDLYDHNKDEELIRIPLRRDLAHGYF